MTGSVRDVDEAVSLLSCFRRTTARPTTTNAPDTCPALALFTHRPKRIDQAAYAATSRAGWVSPGEHLFIPGTNKVAERLMWLLLVAESLAYQLAIVQRAALPEG